MAETDSPDPPGGGDATPRGSGEAPRRSRAARSVSELVPSVSGAAFRRFGFMQNAVVARWAEIVGEQYARYSTPESIVFPVGKKSDGTLKVRVTGSFAPMLKHVEPQVIERVNQYFGYAAVARLALRHGDLPMTVKRITVTEQPLSAETASTLRGIADPDLRASLESLARALSSTRGPPVVR